MNFQCEAFDPNTQVWRRFVFDNDTPTLTENGVLVSLDRVRGFLSPQPPPMFDVPVDEGTRPVRPRKKARMVTRLLIQLGLGCNYTCSYCSQSSITTKIQGSPSDVNILLAALEANVELGPKNLGDDARVEFWGGEPLAYWKTLKPLAEEMRSRYPHAYFSIVTNGSLLDASKVLWLEEMGFSVAISHDGPGQSFRGNDPFDDPTAGPAILDLYRRLRPLSRISFSAILHAGNHRRKPIVDFFVEKTGDPFVPLSEGGFITPYDDAALEMASLVEMDLHSIRRSLYEELLQFPELAANYWTVREDVQKIIRALAYRRPLHGYGQICGKDREDTVTVDMKGNVLTCQNTSADTLAPNGRPHKIGSIHHLDAVRLGTSTSWHHRDNCPTCPVVRLCAGRCMFLAGNEFAAACDVAYTEKVPALAVAFKLITGCQLTRIRAPHLPVERQILWDLKHPELARPMPAAVKWSTTGRTVIPITAVAG